jgi:hypothetical protein
MQDATAGESIFSTAMGNTLQWALGTPVSAAQYSLTFLIVVLGGAYVFQFSASTFNARRWGWTFTGPSWGLGLLGVLTGMTWMLVHQPESLANSSRPITALAGALLAVVVLAAPLTMLLMSISYGAAVSVWLSTLVAAAVVVMGGSVFGAGMLAGKPKVLHWQGEVQVRDGDNSLWKEVGPKRRIMNEKWWLTTKPASAAIVYVRGHQILVMPESLIRIDDIGDEPKVTLFQGRMYSRTSMAASRNMRYATTSAGFKVSNGDVLIAASRANTSAVVADGAIYSGMNVSDATTVVREGQFVVIGAAGIPNPKPVSEEYRQQLEQLTRYFENPFSAPNREMISGKPAAAKEDKPRRADKTEVSPPSETRPGNADLAPPDKIPAVTNAPADPPPAD